MANELTLAEQERRHEVEKTLDDALHDGRRAYMTAGRCLAEIIDSRLYRDEFASFDAYCRELWNIDPTTARRWAGAYKQAQLLKAHEDEGPLLAWDFLTGFHPGHARILNGLPDAQKIEAWTIAKEVTPTPTTALLEQVVDQFKDKFVDVESMTHDEELALTKEVEAKTEAVHLASREWAFAAEGVKRIQTWLRRYDDQFTAAAEAVANIRREVEKLRRIEAPVAK